MTTTLPTREAIAAAEPLDFSERPRTKLMQAEVIHLFYHGVEFTFGISTEAKIHELEQAVDTILKREGWSGTAPTVAQPTHTAPIGNGKAKAERVTPAYSDDGSALCPVHQRELKQGQWGMYCSAKDKTTGEYCKLKFAE